MKAKLVEENTRQRFYKLSEPINKGISDLTGPIEDICEQVRGLIHKRAKQEYVESMLAGFSDGVHVVCISDAFTHVERLVFPACHSEEFGYINVPIEIEGKHTMMIQGGDMNSVYEDEVYLRRLCQLNNLKWEGFEK